MSDRDPAPGEGFAVEAEPEETPFAMVGDWVLLAPIPDRAVRVYCLLRAHVNRKRGDDEVWPSQEKLAAVLGLSKPDDIGKAIKALEGIGAVRKKFRNGRKGRYTVYVVRLHAPAGYAGMCSASEDLHRAGAVDQLTAERVKRLPHRTQAAVAAAREENTPDLGSPEQTTPDLGATPDPVRKAPLDQGVKPYEGEPDEETALSSSAAPPREDVERLCRELRDRMIQNGCKPPTITKAWRDSARLLLDRDGRELDKAMQVLDWTMKDEFWMANVQSMGTFRKQYDKLRLKAVYAWQQERRAAAPAGLAKNDARLKRQIEQHDLMFDEHGNFRADLSLDPAPSQPYALASASSNGAHR